MSADANRELEFFLDELGVSSVETYEGDFLDSGYIATCIQNAGWVRVIRCKDCKHCGTYHNWNQREYLGCNVIPDEIVEVGPEEFCSWAERKEC